MSKEGSALSLQAGVHHARRDTLKPDAESGELVRRAILTRIRDAADAQNATVVPHAAFDAAYHLKGRKAFFRSSLPAVRIVVRIVPKVDTVAVEACWPAALRCGANGEVVCVLLLGASLAAPRELGACVAEQRRRTRGAAPLVIPVDIRDWQALIPAETPESVRTLVARIGSRR